MNDKVEPLPRRLARLCLSGRRHLPGGQLFKWAVRTAIATELVFAGRVSVSDEQVTIDTTPTGYAPSDDFLRAIDQGSETDLDDWVTKGPDCLDSVVADLTADRTWTHHGLGGYHDRDAAVIAQELHLLRQAREVIPSEPRPAALAAILLAIGADRLGYPPEELLNACGPASWLLPDLTKLLSDARTDDLALARVDMSYLGNPFGSGI